MTHFTLTDCNSSRQGQYARIMETMPYNILTKWFWLYNHSTIVNPGQDNEKLVHTFIHHYPVLTTDSGLYPTDHVAGFSQTNDDPSHSGSKVSFHTLGSNRYTEYPITALERYLKARNKSIITKLRKAAAEKDKKSGNQTKVS